VSRPVLCIRGESVGLAPVTVDMAPQIQRWNNDARSFRTLGADPRPTTAGRARELIDAVGRDDTRVTFAIVDLADMAPVGTASVTHIDRRHQVCEIDLAIMEADRRGQGLGTETVRLLTGYAIRELGMHNVQLRVFAFNHAGVRAYEKAGFREYGRRREAWLHDGRRWDIVFMEVLASEWDSHPPRRQPFMETGIVKP
jgi:RimJ/RimL family protein N-acetyltransferase